MHRQRLILAPVKAANQSGLLDLYGVEFACRQPNKHPLVHSRCKHGTRASTGPSAQSKTLDSAMDTRAPVSFTLHQSTGPRGGVKPHTQCYSMPSLSCSGRLLYCWIPRARLTQDPRTQVGIWNPLLSDLLHATQSFYGFTIGTPRLALIDIPAVMVWP